MATNNFLLKGSRRKVGNIVTYSRNGKQVVRAVPTSVKNPQSTGQRVQRAAFAPAAKFYSPLSVVLETAWQGKNKSESYSAFLKKAIEDARKNSWLLPKGTGFFPLPHQVTKGSIKPLSYIFDDADESVCVDAAGISEAPTTIGALSQIFINQGYRAGDQITIILVASDADIYGIAGDSEAIMNANYWPVSCKFNLNTNANTPIATALPEMECLVDDGQLEISAKFGHTCAAAIIVSHYENEVWRRSTQRVVVHGSIMLAVAEYAQSGASADTYKSGGNGQPDSDVYLNGGEQYDEKVQVTVSASPASGGTVTGGGKFLPGTEVTVRATKASEDVEFSGWFENGTKVSDDLNYTFTVEQSVNLVARFITPSVVITASVNPVGAGTITGNEGEYSRGETVTLTASGDTADYTFQGWYENNQLVSSNRVYSFTATEDRTLVARYDGENG